ETAINALVAGHTPHQAVIIVTRGALEQLSREELQGVMGHEFSHILNGDMALNLRLVGILAGLTWFSEQGEKLVYRTAWQFKDLPSEDRGAGVLAALFGAVVAFIGFPGSLAADAIKAAISRQREFLADAASVQFTRNPEAIAGALDSILALRAPTVVLAVHSEQLSHMFFALAVSRWWSFSTHPPIEERIRRVHPRFLRDDYRATRHGIRREVAVLDDAGNVIPKAVDFAARLLAELPPALREALRQPEGAQAALAAGAEVQAAFEKGAAALKLGWRSPLAAERMTSATIGGALERLRHLAPFAKPGLLKACVATAGADGVFRIAEAELIRMVAATLDCPLPPGFAELDPKSWGR